MEHISEAHPLMVPVHELISFLSHPFGLKSHLGSTPSILVDIQELPLEYKVTAEISGANKTDIKIEVRGQTLTIIAKINETDFLQDAKNIQRERYYGTLSRTLVFESPIQSHGVKASYQDGLLFIVALKDKQLLEQNIIDID